MSELKAIYARLRKWPYFFAMLALLATTLSLWRIVASYHEISSTIDESYFLATGMQFLDHDGKYTYPSSHPPVAEIASALLPYLDGATAHGNARTYDEGLAVLHGQNTYWRTLILERLGILPFYLIGVFLLWSWSKKMYGEKVAFITVLFYTLTPPILAHAGIANTDVPLTTAIIGASYALWWWIQRPNRDRSILLGFAIGFAACTKLTFFLFFPVASLVIIGYEYFVIKSFRQKIKPISKTFQFAGIALLTTCLTIWAIYGFSVGTIPNGKQILDGGGTLRNAPPTTGAVVPAPEFFGAILAVNKYNAENGTTAYFLGKHTEEGVVWFFPVTLALKTPIALLLASIIASFLIFLNWTKIRPSEKWIQGAVMPFLISAGIMITVLPAKIHFGVHHILPIYPFLAMLGAFGIVWIWKSYGDIGKAGAALLLLWTFFSSISYDPDRLAYFNEFTSASRNPPLLLGSLDWGQDLDKLSDTLQARGIKSYSMRYYGSAHLESHGLSGFKGLWEPAEWVAVSKYIMYGDDGYTWLRDETPTARIGNTILLFHFSDADIARLRAKISGKSEAPAKDTTDQWNALRIN